MRRNSVYYICLSSLGRIHLTNKPNIIWFNLNTHWLKKEFEKLVSSFPFNLEWTIPKAPWSKPPSPPFRQKPPVIRNYSFNRKNFLSLTFFDGRFFLRTMLRILRKYRKYQPASFSSLTLMSSFSSLYIFFWQIF